MELERWDIHMQNVNLDTDLTSFTQNPSKWIMTLNVKCKTIKLLEDNIGELTDGLDFGNEILHATLKI